MGGSIEIYTSHWRSPLLRDADAQVVGISRGTPRGNPGFRYRLARELAPSRAAFALEDREAFEEAYTRQLEEIGPRAILERLEALSRGRPTILLCWERLLDSGEWCHRRMLADYLRERAGIEVPEVAPGDLPRRPDSPEPRLF
jgi:hypothetical protein